MLLSDVEHDIYRHVRNNNKRQDREGWNNSLSDIQEDYYRIYSNYLQDLVINLIGYENAPKTLDQRFLEWQLRNFGVAGVVVEDKDHIALLSNKDENDPKQPYWNSMASLGMFGYLTAPSKQRSPFSNKNVDFITQLNYENFKGKGGYVVIPNKFNYYFNYGFNSVLTDFQLISRVAFSLSLIKANQLRNVNLMKQQYIYFVKNNNLSGKNIIEQINAGRLAVGIDSDITDISSLVQLTNLDIKDFLPSLKEQWNNELSELLTMLGVNTIGVDKKERLVQAEANGNSQLIEASANIYLQARQQQLDLINEVAGTSIKAAFNQSAYDELVKLAHGGDEIGQDKRDSGTDTN